MTKAPNPRQILEQAVSQLEAKIAAVQHELAPAMAAREQANCNFQISESPEDKEALANADEALASIATRARDITSALRVAKDKLQAFERYADAKINKTLVDSTARELKRASADVVALAVHLEAAISLYNNLVVSTNACKQRTKYWPQWGVAGRSHIQALIAAELYRLSDVREQDAFPGAKKLGDALPSKLPPMVELFADNVARVVKHINGQAFDDLIQHAPSASNDLMKERLTQ